MSVTRRQFFARTTLAAGAVLGFPAVAGAAVSEKHRYGRKPRRIIQLVSDGMSLGTLSCADQLSLLVRGRHLAWTTLYQREATMSALVNMRSLNSLVTDSAAASSSWGCGSRVKNGALNVLPDGRSLQTLCTLFAEETWARGLVTTTEITHATPAGFAVNAEDRGSAEEIAVQYLDRQIEVLLGGGRPYFDPAKRKDKRDLKADFRARGYATFETKSELAAAPMNRNWLGTFAGGHLPFTLDWTHDAKLQATVPTLAEMTRLALARLSRSRHFLLQVEGGRVDHGAHSSDAAAALYDQIAFDEALEACLQFQREEPDTLMVVTTDHGTANLGLNGMGGSYEKSPQLFANLQKVTKSFGEIDGLIRKAAGKSRIMERKAGGGKDARTLIQIPVPELIRVLGETTGYEVPKGKAAAFARFLAGDSDPLYGPMDSNSAQLGQLLANYLGIGWTGTSHTSDYVPLVAIGPGAEHFRGFIDNTDVFHHYLTLGGIRFHNPQLPLLAESGPSAAEVERYAAA